MRRNPNFVSLGVEYAVTEMSLLRRVPNYSGDNFATTGATQFGNGATSYLVGGAIVPYSVRIPKPIDQDDVQVIQVQDLISFNNSTAQYQITAINEVAPDGFPFLDLTLNDGGMPTLPGSPETATNLPDPSAGLTPYAFNALMPLTPFTSGVPFTVQRSPRILRSSTLTLPDGFIIDLRFSGFSALDSGYQGKTGILDPDIVRGAGTFPTSVLEPFPRTVETYNSGAMLPVVNYADADVGVLFNASGSVDQIFMRKVYDFNEDGMVDGTTGNDPAAGTIGDRVSTYSKLALESLYLFVTEQEEDQTLNPLSVDTNLWVSVSNSTGVTNVGYNIPSNSNFSVADMRMLYDGTLPNGDPPNVQRDTFNAEIINSRNLTNLGTAAQ